MSRVLFPEFSLRRRSVSHPRTEPQQQVYVSIFSRYYADVVRLLCGMLPNKQDAEDLAQEVLLRIIRAQEPEKLSQNPKAYLFQIATNLVRDRIRQQHAQKYAHDCADDTDVEQLSAIAASPEQHVGAAETLAGIQAILQRLPNEDKRIFIWCKMYQLSTKEISERMNLPLRTVQRRLTDVLSQITMQLEQGDD